MGFNLKIFKELQADMYTLTSNFFKNELVIYGFHDQTGLIIKKDKVYDGSLEREVKRYF